MDELNMELGEPPYDLEAEQTVLGALLLDPEAMPAAMRYIKPESFYVSKHRDLFAIIQRLFTLGVTADIITVISDAVKEGVFESSSAGREYLASIMDAVPSTRNIESYCRIVEEKYYRRALISAARDIADAASAGQETSEQLLDYAEQKIYDIRSGRSSEDLKRIDEVVLETYDELGRRSGPDKEEYIGAKSGYADLDGIITGLNRSDLIVIAGRPGMGKTSFALNIISNVARRSKETDIVIFSLEMSKEQIVTKMLASASFVELEYLMKGNISGEQWVKLAEGAERLSGMNIYLDDTAGITVPQMKAKLRRLRRPGLVVIDYLQLMNSAKRIDNRVNEISEITRQLKLMAKDLDVPVITLSQLSRSVESRTDKRPLLSDLRESGSIEQDADIVMFLYREGYYNKTAPDQNAAECIVAKNRHGETGTVNLRWNGQYTLFLGTDRRQN